jgi:hypothetical protein
MRLNYLNIFDIIMFGYINSILFSLNHMKIVPGALNLTILSKRITNDALGKSALALSFPLLDNDIIRTQTQVFGPQVITPLIKHSKKFNNIDFNPDIRFDMLLAGELALTYNHLALIEIFQSRFNLNLQAKSGLRQIRNFPSIIPGCYYLWISPF